ncbi:MAG: endonuclease [Oleiphilaceae bacterium]|nr:endonuclease [Oleiphilaceae bacterium]
MRFAVWLLWLLLPVVALPHSGPTSWAGVKADMREHVYMDRNTGRDGTVYCGCDWEWQGRSGGRVVLDDQCPYSARRNGLRGESIEWEHILPASTMAKLAGRACWGDGGRSVCVSEDPQFTAQYTDQHNITPSIGEINADRGNFAMAPVGDSGVRHGGCLSSVSFEQRRFEPRDQAKGFVARAYFYMSDFYDIPLPESKQRTLMDWHSAHPPTDWERERSRRIAKRIGRENPYITGDRQWTLNQARSGDGLKAVQGRYQPAVAESETPATGPIIGNRNSRVYHLPDCPSYDRVAQRNRVPFASEKDAEQSGFRKAGNC